jgi:hypothetical protein
VFEKLTTRSPFAEVVAGALEEARRRGDRRMGTEHLLLGLLRHPPTATALGVHLDVARAALDDLDHAALRAIGIDTDAIPGLAELPRRHPPITISAVTSGSRTALRHAVDSTGSRTRHLAPRHLLTTLLDREHPDPVVALIDRLGVDRAATRARLGAG